LRPRAAGGLSITTWTGCSRVCRDTRGFIPGPSRGLMRPCPAGAAVGGPRWALRAANAPAGRRNFTVTNFNDSKTAGSPPRPPPSRRQQRKIRNQRGRTSVNFASGLYRHDQLASTMSAGSLRRRDPHGPVPWAQAGDRRSGGGRGAPMVREQFRLTQAHPPGRFLRSPGWTIKTGGRALGGWRLSRKGGIRPSNAKKLTIFAHPKPRWIHGANSATVPGVLELTQAAREELRVSFPPSVHQNLLHRTTSADRQQQQPLRNAGSGLRYGRAGMRRSSQVTRTVRSATSTILRQPVVHSAPARKGAARAGDYRCHGRTEGCRARRERATSGDAWGEAGLLV